MSKYSIILILVIFSVSCSDQSLQEKLENKSWEVIDATNTSNYVAFRDSGLFVCTDDGWFNYGKYILLNDEMTLTIKDGRYVDSYDITKINIRESGAVTKLSYLAKRAGKPNTSGDIKLFTLSDSGDCEFDSNTEVKYFQ